MSVLGVSKNLGKTPKMDDLEWKSIWKWMIWGENPPFSETLILIMWPVGYFFSATQKRAASSMQFPLDVARSLKGSFCERCDGYSWHLLLGYQTRLAKKMHQDPGYDSRMPGHQLAKISKITQAALRWFFVGILHNLTQKKTQLSWGLWIPFSR